MTQSAKRLRFVLTEDGKSVKRAILALDGLRVLEFVNVDPPRVRVRHPKMDEKVLVEMAEYWSHPRQALKSSPHAVLDQYINARDEDIAKHVIEIRRSLHKIAVAVRNAKMARNAKRNLRK